MRQQAGWYSLAILLWGLVAVSSARHGSWQDHYQDATGMSCCGPRDCTVVPVSLVRQEGEVMHALVMGIPVNVPIQSVHPSEDTQSWWCRRDLHRPPASDNVRCLFYAVGG